MSENRGPLPYETADAVIIGAGPAGSSCAQWLRLLGFNPLLVDSHEEPGGMALRNPYPNAWLSILEPRNGEAISQAISDNIKLHGIRFANAVQALRIDACPEGFLATGTRRGAPWKCISRRLVLATGSRIATGGIFGDGLSHGPGRPFESLDFDGKKLAILGGGDNAGDAYAFSQGRASSRTVFSRKPPRMQRSLLEKIAEGDLRIGPIDIRRGDEAWIINGEAFERAAVMFGYEPSLPPMGFELAKGSDGYLAVDGRCAASAPGAFAIGELTNRMHPCVATAMADGVVAAKAIEAEILLERRADHR